MASKNTLSDDFQKNSTKIRKSNYHKELNSRKFMRPITIANYLSGILGCNVSIADADFIEIKWNYLALPSLIVILLQPLLVAKFFIQLDENVYEALATIPVIESAIGAIVQRFRVLHLEMRLKEIYGHICKRWDEELQNGINDEIVKNAKKYIFFPKLYIMFMVSAVMSYVIRPFGTLFTYYVLNGNETFTETNILPAAYPFAIDTMWKWALCNFLEAFYVIIFIALAVSDDLAFVQMCALLSLQIQAVGDKLQNIVRENDSRTTMIDGTLERRLLELGRQHCELRETCRKIEDAFNPGILAIMIGTSINLCACAISVEKELSENNFGAAATLVFHFSAVMIQIFVYCNTAEDISHQLEKISQKIYESQWLGYSKKFQRMMIMIMLQSNIPFKFKVYGFYNVDRVQLTKVIALTYNLVVALRNIRSFKTV